MVISRALRPWLLLLSAVSLGVLQCATPLTDRRCDNLDTRSCNQPVSRGDNLTLYRQANRAARPVPGGTVNVTDVVVTAIDRYLEPRGSTGDAWVQQIVTDPAFDGCAPLADGRHVCGIQLFNPTVVPTGTHLLLGDTLQVSGGRYDEFDCARCCQPPRAPCTFDGRTLPEFSNASLERIGTGQTPVIVPATVTQVLEGGDRYVGVLVSLTGEISLENPSASDVGRGEIPVVGGMKLSPQIGPLTDRMGQPLINPTTGRLTTMRLRNVVGIVGYFFGTKFMPRGPMDFEVVP